MKLLFTALITFFAIVLLGCSREKAAGGALPVFVSIVPQKFFLDKIGGPLVSTSVMVEPGASPHAYEPRPSQMTALAKARAYFSIGMEFEKAWLPRFQSVNRVLTVVPMDSGIAKRPITDLEEGPAGSGADAGHHHEGLDPHVWLSPELAKKQGRTTCEALCRLDPAHDSAYRANGRAFEAEITGLQDTIRAILQRGGSAAAKRTFMVFHPSWGYFAAEFNLRQVAIEIEGKEPSARQLQIIIETAKKENIRTIFTQPQFSPRSAEIIARQIGGAVAVADDLAYDWERNLVAFAKALAAK
jgi:zinc transport system substrate-binding protein